MLSYSLKREFKKKVHEIFLRLSPRKGLSRSFPLLRSVAEWIGTPPKAPLGAKARIQTASCEFELFLKPHDPTISPKIYAEHIWEPNETFVFEQCLHPGDTVLDIGAHIGYYSVIAGKKVGPSGKVFSFEPDPANLEILKRNIELNGLEQVVEIIPKAVGNERGERLLYGSKADDTSDRTLFEIKPGQKIQHRVECVRVEDYLKENFPALFPKIRVIKMDIEGFEPYAVQGMQEILNRDGVLLFTEVNYQRLRQAGSSAEQYLKQLFQFGFEFWAIDQKTADRQAALSKTFAETLQTDRENHVDLLCQKSNSPKR